MNTFLARYAGICARCDEGFPPGTAVVWSPDGGEAMALAHEHCPAEPAGNARRAGRFHRHERGALMAQKIDNEDRPKFWCIAADERASDSERRLLGLPPSQWRYVASSRTIEGARMDPDRIVWIDGWQRHRDSERIYETVMHNLRKMRR